MSKDSRQQVSIPAYIPYTALYGYHLTQVLAAAKQRVEELEILLDDIENGDCNCDDHYCNHSDDEIISMWVAGVVADANFHGIDYLIADIEAKALEGGVAFNVKK